MLKDYSPNYNGDLSGEDQSDDESSQADDINIPIDSITVPATSEDAVPPKIKTSS